MLQLALSVVLDVHSVAAPVSAQRNTPRSTFLVCSSDAFRNLRWEFMGEKNLIVRDGCVTQVENELWH